MRRGCTQEAFCSVLLLAIFAAGSCGPASSDPSAAKPSSIVIQLTSPAFREGDPIPPQFTCKGSNVSPELHWSDPPKDTQSLALICDDPDAPGGTFVHWVIFNIPAGVRSFPEHFGAPSPLSDRVTFGRNDFGRLEYSGPCPPPGKPHRYFFKLYALDTWLSLARGATKKNLEAAIENHILGSGQLMGTFKR